MTKTKRNLILVVSLFFAIFTLCSVFAGVALYPPQQTVEAATLTDAEMEQRRTTPGLYKTGTTTLKTSWADLINNKDITTNDGRLQVVNKKLAGDLICDCKDLYYLDFAFANCLNLTGVELICEDGVMDKLDGAFYNCKSLKYCKLGGSISYTCVGMFAGCQLETLDMSGNETQFTDTLGTDGFTACFGALGLSDEYCLSQLNELRTNKEVIVGAYENAMNNLNILENLENYYTSDSQKWIIDLYKEKAEGKTGSELGKCGKIACVVSWTWTFAGQSQSVSREEVWELTEKAFEIKIETIYLPQYAAIESSLKRSVGLPNGNYVYELNGKKVEMTYTYLQGYKELDIADDSLTGLAIFVNTLEAPNPKIGNAEESVPVAMVVIVICGVGVVVAFAMIIRKIIHDKKHKNRKF